MLLWRLQSVRDAINSELFLQTSLKVREAPENIGESIKKCSNIGRKRHKPKRVRIFWSFHLEFSGRSFKHFHFDFF